MRLILWTIDEVIVFLVPFLVLLLAFNQTVLGAVLGVCFVLGIKKTKGEQGHYFFYSLIYWHLPGAFHLKATPPSYYREFLG